MKLTLVVIAAVIAQQSAPSVFDQPIGQLREDKLDGPLERLSLNQMMRLTALPAARMLEFQCAGLARWQGSQDWPAFALPEVARAKFIDDVVGALANDVEIDREVALALVAGFEREPPYREEKGELPAYRAEMEGKCAGLIADVRAGTYRLAPPVSPSVVNPTLASCYARYTVAAEGAEPDEAKALGETAARAQSLVLMHKAGDELAQAQSALAEGLAAARAEKSPQSEEEMMRLVICLPAMAAAEKELAQKEPER